jgi:hypothetical protein
MRSSVLFAPSAAQKPENRDTGSVFRLFRPSEDEKLKLLTTARETLVSSPQLLTAGRRFDQLVADLSGSERTELRVLLATLFLAGKILLRNPGDVAIDKVHLER